MTSNEREGGFSEARAADPACDREVEERRTRVMNKLKASNHDDEGQGVDNEAVSAPKGRGELCLQQSRCEMADVLSCANTAVTTWEVSSFANENERREREERAMEERRSLRREMMEKNEEMYGAIQLNFESIYTLNISHELKRSLDEQRGQCEEMIAVKDRLISALREQLEEREEEFVVSLRRNTADVNSLIVEMRRQTEKYLNTYTKKLREVEDAYELERMESLARWNEEMQQLVKLRRTRETEYRKKRELKIMTEKQILDDKLRDNSEDYNVIKREHLQEIHAITEELERCKAEFLLNGERLSYNLQVLRERVKENKSAQAMHKRKLARLQDTLSSLIARYADSEKRYQRTNKELTTQLHRVAGQYRDLQKKFQKFEKYDKEKYRQLWRMHEEKNIQLAHKCLQADRVIFEEILGVPWNPPELNYWPVDDANDHEEEEEEDGVSSDEEIELSEEALMFLAILDQQAPFIEDENVVLAIQEVKGVSDERVVVEAILSSLQIHKNAEMEDMLEYFVTDAEGGEDETVAHISPQEAVHALSAFLRERQRREQQKKEESQSRTSRKNKQMAKMKLEDRRRAAGKMYWSRMAESVPKDHQQVWGMLERGLKRYISQLQQRKQLIETSDTLRAQNGELRGLLAQYLQSGVNHELHMPPKLLLEARVSS